LLTLLADPIGHRTPISNIHNSLNKRRLWVLGGVDARVEWWSSSSRNRRRALFLGARRGGLVRPRRARFARTRIDYASRAHALFDSKAKTY